MNHVGAISCAMISVIAMTLVSTAHAADARYPVRQVQRIDIIEPSGGSSWEDKNWLDCDDVILTEKDVRYALQHIRRISEKSYFSEENMDRSGCSGGASVTFKNGKIIVMDIEPTGRIRIFETTNKLKAIGKPSRYYDCAPCKKRKMDLLQDALDRATERRLKELKRQGRLPP
ncbi:hypothetical protein [Delftia acidovorans]